MKILSLIGVTLTISLTGLIVNSLGPSIYSELKKSGTKLISLEDNEGGKIRVEEYSKSNSKDIENKSYVDEEELKTGCSNSWQKSYDEINKDLYEKVKKGCSRPKTMEDHIAEEYKVSFLKDKDTEAGKKKVESYAYGGRIVGIFDDISISKTGEKILKKDMNTSKLKIGCSHKKEEYYSDSKTYSEKYTLAKGCTNYQY